MPYKILIVDDDKDFRSELREILREEYEVMEASDGEEAIYFVKEPNVIDLIILDVKLPGLQGTEVLKRIKTIDPEIFIIMLTGYGRKDIIIDSLRGHADEFLEKPVNIDEILKIIRNHFASKQQEVDGIINKMTYFIEKNYHKNISLKNLSGIVFLSPKYISRIFKSSTGYGFIEYKLRFKIQKAKEFLDNTNMNIKEISYQVGYRNVESFIRLFKRFQGCTPVEYRQNEKVKEKVKNG